MKKHLLLFISILNTKPFFSKNAFSFFLGQIAKKVFGACSAVNSSAYFNRQVLQRFGHILVFVCALQMNAYAGILTPTISTTGAPSAVSTTYGTASGSISFSVSGSNMLAGILVTSPAGFEVSNNNTTFSATVTIGGAGNTPPTTVYIRLAAVTGAGSYSGNIVLSSTGATNVNVIMPSSVVSPAPLTIAAANATKTYGQTLTSGPGSTAFTVTGLQNGETVGSVTTGYGPGSAGTDGVGTYYGCVTAANATGGTFNPANYAISYAGANIIVNPAQLTIAADNVTKTYGQTLTGGPGSTAFTTTGLQNGETIGSVTISYGSGAAASFGVGTYVDCVTVSQGTGGTFRGNNYTITHTPANIIVNPASLTVTANNVNKPYGIAIQGSSGSTAFTISDLQNGETAGTVTINYGSGSAANAPMNTYYQCVTAANLTGGDFTASNYTITYVPGNIIVGDDPTIYVNGSPSGVNTVYGTPSTSSTFTVTGGDLNAGILITPPTGFEVSADGITFSSPLTVGSAGVFGPLAIYIRLAAATVVGTYSGPIKLTSSPAAEVDLNMPSSDVSPALLTVIANNASKGYDQPNPALSVSYVGFKNGDGPDVLTVKPDITTTATLNSPVGEYPITASGAEAANYTVDYTPGELTIYPSAQMVQVPNAFTPNGDGINDTWNIKYLNVFQSATVQIFNRSGQTVYNSTGYSIPWDGTYRGSMLPTGTYYYLINFNNGVKPLSGYVTLIR